MGYNPPPPPVIRPAIVPPPPPKNGPSEPKIPDWIEMDRQQKDRDSGWGWLSFALILGLLD